MTMTSFWNRKTAALAAPLMPPAAGQQLFFIPLSASPSLPRTARADPPSLQRRMAAAVRDECRAVPGCGGPSDPLALAAPPFVSAAASLERQMDALFAELFSPRLSLLGKEEEEDPLDKLFETMMGASLRAYDRKAMNLPIVTGDEEGDDEVVAGEGDDDVEGGGIAEKIEEEEWEFEEELQREEEEFEEELHEAEEERYDEDDGVDEVGDVVAVETEDSYASMSADYLEAAATPEEAAENALDVMVASLARCGNRAAKEQERGEEDGEEVAGGADAADWLPQVLDRLGKFAETHSRRRLSEGAADPHAGVRERLARRLTEYRSDVFVSPDGTVTMYTTSYTPLSSVHSSSSVFEGAPSSPPFLGTGSRRADECLRSRFDNGDLAGGCRRAVQEALLAAGVPVSDGEAPRAPDGSLPERFLSDSVVDVEPRACGFSLGHALALFFLMMGCAVLGGMCFRQDEDDQEEDEFDYAPLHDRPQPKPLTRNAKHIFVGVPF